jgi:hypothetical protein
MIVSVPLMDPNAFSFAAISSFPQARIIRPIYKMLKSGLGHGGGGVENVIANIATCPSGMLAYLGVQELDEFFELLRHTRQPSLLENQEHHKVAPGQQEKRLNKESARD